MQCAMKVLGGSNGNAMSMMKSLAEKQLLGEKDEEDIPEWNTMQKEEQDEILECALLAMNKEDPENDDIRTALEALQEYWKLANRKTGKKAAQFKECQEKVKPVLEKE